MKGCQVPSSTGGILEVALSLSATSLEKSRSQSAECLSYVKILFLGMPRSRSALKALKSSVPGSSLKTRVGVSHYTEDIRVHTKAAQGKLSSALCFTGERIHLGFAGPDLALNWEEAAHHLPITPPGARTASSCKNQGRRWGSCPLSLSGPSPAPPQIHPVEGACTSLSPIATEWNPNRPEFPTAPLPPSGDPA